MQFSGFRVLGLAALGAGILAAAPVAAAPKAPASDVSAQSRVYDGRYYDRPAPYIIRRKTDGTRIVVRRRSYLDPGTEVLPYSQNYTNYAIPPRYSPTEFYLGPGNSYFRQPLPDPFDVPGINQY